MDTVKWHPNERVGLGDMEAGTGALVRLDQIRERAAADLPVGRTTGQALTSARVLSGFLATYPTATTVLIAAGDAIVSYLDGATPRHGLVVGGQTPDDYTLDFSAAAVTTHAVYMRAVYSESDSQNRIFWNAATPEEEVDNIPTRRTATWEVTYQDASLAPPGNGEWVKIWEVVVGGGPVITSLVDFRHFFYEGSAHTTDAYAHEWGDGANDRNDDRATYGVGDSHMFAQLVRRQLADVIGLPAGGDHLAHRLPSIELESLAVEHYSEATAPTGSDYGKHKLVTLGAAGRWWTITTVGTDPAASTQLRLTTVGGDAPVLQIIQNPVSGVSGFYWNPRGLGSAMTNGDSHLEVVGAGDFARRQTRIALTSHEYQWDAGVVSPAMTLRAGAAVTQKGLELPADYDYYIETLSTSILVALDTFRGAAASGWYLTGPTDGDISAAVAGGVWLQSAVLDDNLFVEVRDFPEGATLDKIQVLWAQTAVGGGSQEMRMYVGRHNDLGSGASRTDGDVSSGFEYGVQKLHTVTNHIEYVKNVSTANILTFTPNQNNVDWHKYASKLVLGFRTPDASFTAARVYWVRCYWTYEKATPYPLLSV